MRGGPNLDRLGKIAAWFQADNQGRTYDDASGLGMQSAGPRVQRRSWMANLPRNVTAGVLHRAVAWRNATKNAAETTMWLNETLASGMIPYYHFVGSENGFGEDRRWQKTGADYFQWTAKHDAHLNISRSIANIGVVMGQSTQLLYPGAGARSARASTCTRRRRESTTRCCEAGTRLTMCMRIAGAGEAEQISRAAAAEYCHAE